MTFPNDETLVCNCCECGGELIGRTNPPEVIAQAHQMHLCLVAGRITDGERHKPYCDACLAVVCPDLERAAV